MSLFQDFRDFRGWRRQLRGIPPPPSPPPPPPPRKHPGAAPGVSCYNFHGASCYILTTVEINVHTFHLHLTRGQTNKTTHKQTNTMAHIHQHNPADTCKHCAMSGWTKLSRRYYYIKCNNLPQVV